MKISGIPTYVIDGHQEAFRLFMDLGIKNKSLVHVDNHSDMWDGTKKSMIGSNRGKFQPRCCNYIIPSIYEKHINDVWWVNPYSFTKYCLNLFEHGSSIDSLIELYNTSNSSMLYWKSQKFNKRVVHGIGFQNHQLPSIKNRSYVLDIDLDAFSCCRGLTNSEHEDPSEKNYASRIDRTIDTLAAIGHKPEIIIIAKSQERHIKNSYVSRRLVGPVKRNLIRELKKLYSN